MTQVYLCNKPAQVPLNLKYIETFFKKRLSFPFDTLLIPIDCKCAGLILACLSHPFVFGCFYTSTIWLLLCQYHAIFVTIAFWHLKFRQCEASSFLLLKIALSIKIFWFHTSFIVFSISVKRKCHWNFHRDCIKYVDHIGWVV